MNRQESCLETVYRPGEPVEDLTAGPERRSPRTIPTNHSCVGERGHSYPEERRLTGSLPDRSSAKPSESKSDSPMGFPFPDSSSALKRAPLTEVVILKLHQR